MPERTFTRIGSISAIVGAVIFMAGNMLHARSSDIEITAEQVKAVAGSDIWVTDHLLFVLGALLMVGGLVALQRSITSEPGASWARFGYLGAIVSSGLVAVLGAIDGIASKVVHDTWAAATGSDKAMALMISEALEEIDIGLFSIVIIVFFGITFILYGLAVALSEVYPKWLGWVAVALGVGSFTLGTVQAYVGLSVLGTNFLFAGFASLLTVWVLVMAILMWRKTRSAT
ncbi:MAG: hypothetical protein IIA54_04385 [Chloroflexi bacterium]|nr:hypothetical protein [Chloroflexota bacterium]